MEAVSLSARKLVVVEEKEVLLTQFFHRPRELIIIKKLWPMMVEELAYYLLSFLRVAR